MNSHDEKLYDGPTCGCGWCDSCIDRQDIPKNTYGEGHKPNVKITRNGFVGTPEEQKALEEAHFMNGLATQMIMQFKAKNVAYGDSFGKQFQKYGPVSALVRISDKFSRMEALILGAKNEVVDEKIEDTLVDMACYCLMTVYELKRKEESQNVK